MTTAQVINVIDEVIKEAWSQQGKDEEVSEYEMFETVEHFLKLVRVRIEILDAKINAECRKATPMDMEQIKAANEKQFGRK